MNRREPVPLSTTEILAAARALGSVVRNNPDVATSDAELEAAVRALFALLYQQQQSFGWRPSGLTLAPWAVEVLARLLAAPAPAPLPKPNKRTAKATLQPSSAPRRAERIG